MFEEGKNISYRSIDISDYFSKNRISFDSFYESEKEILSSVDWFDGISVLDVGCGCGGLGLALNKKFGVFDYTGVDIHSESIKIAKDTNAIVGFSFENSDFMKFDVGQRYFDVVTSLSCVDWNLETDAMINKCWSVVKPGGAFIATFRLAQNSKSNDRESYQYINYNGKKKGELAPYVILSYEDIFKLGKKFNASKVKMSGYFRKPSEVAVTSHDELFFCCVLFQKH